MSPLSSGSSRQDQAKDPAKRLHRFEKEYGNLLVSFQDPTALIQLTMHPANMANVLESLPRQRRCRNPRDPTPRAYEHPQ